MIDKAANFVKKIIEPTTNVAAAAGAVVLG